MEPPTANGATAGTGADGEGTGADGEGAVDGEEERREGGGGGDGDSDEGREEDRKRAEEQRRREEVEGQSEQEALGMELWADPRISRLSQATSSSSGGWVPATQERSTAYREATKEGIDLARSLGGGLGEGGIGGDWGGRDGPFQVGRGGKGGGVEASPLPAGWDIVKTGEQSGNFNYFGLLTNATQSQVTLP